MKMNYKKPPGHPVLKKSVAVGCRATRTDLFSARLPFSKCAKPDRMQEKYGQTSYQDRGVEKPDV